MTEEDNKINAGNETDKSRKDLSGLDPQVLKELTEKRIAEEQELRKAEEKDSGKLPAPGEVDSKFVLECLGQNEVGDGRLFAALKQGEFIFNKRSGEWLQFKDHHWRRDIMGMALAAVEDVVARYLSEAPYIENLINEAAGAGDKGKMEFFRGQQERLFKRASRLRTDRGRRNCLACAHTRYEPAAVEGDEFDLDPWVIACKNGVVDLRTGILRPGRPDDFISRACPHEYRSVTDPAPEFLKFLDSTFNGDQDLIDFLQRFLGYMITGLTLQRKFLMLYGQGQNGKGILVETLLHVLGPLARPIQSEMLLDQGRSRSAAGPSPDVMALKGLRIAFASETDEGRKFSSARLKWLTGGDSLVGRAPHAIHETCFLPSHSLVLSTNNKPSASSYDFAIWERMVLVPFKYSFVNRKPQADNEREADLFLQERLMKEASGILAWLICGCIKWQEEGLNPPRVILEAIAGYQRDENLLADWIEDCAELDPNAKAQASDLYDSFSEWFIKNVSRKGFSQRRFGRLMNAAGFQRMKSGTVQYTGLSLLAG